MKKHFIIITIIILVSITVFIHNRKSVNNSFTGTIYTINYCNEGDYCDEMIKKSKVILK